MSWPRSLQGQLVISLAAIFLVATAVILATVIYQGYETARALSDDSLAHEFLNEFITDVAWVIPIFAGTVLAVVVWTVRRGLQPLRGASEMATRIAPSSPSVRLPTADLPVEVAPLVAAVNEGLDRLERGFAAQRQFTASAAHQLRTPLAILIGGLENLGDGPEVKRLLLDAGRMNRLVDQLLRVARLDSTPLNVSGRAELRTIAADAVAYLAPWAIDQGRTLGFEAPDDAVCVGGNADALSDALRNLIENAVLYAPVGTEVTVAVTADGRLSVLDRGPGISMEDRKHIFERFWRGQGASRAFAGGTGLGLAIVAEIAKAHGATIEIVNPPGGGTQFILQFARLFPE